MIVKIYDDKNQLIVELMPDLDNCNSYYFGSKCGGCDACLLQQVEGTKGYRFEYFKEQTI